MGATTFKYDKNGNLVAYRDGKRVGLVGGMGDAPKKDARKQAGAKRTKGKK